MTDRALRRPNQLLASMIAAAGLLFLGCGEGEMADDQPASTESGRETFYKHGTPPGNAPWTYGLTSYADGGTPACGGKGANGTWYYSTGAYTFGCGARLRLEANGKCVVVAVVDNGPAEWVEKKAKKQCGGTGYLIDASPLVSKYLFGTSSAGWSDCYEMQVTQVAKGTKTGPVSCSDDPTPSPSPSPTPSPTPSPAPAAGWIGDSCSDASSCSTGMCLPASDGFADGMCTKTCTSLCPDKSGKAETFCTAVGGQGLCVSRCDYKLFPVTGCRQGYSCGAADRFNGDGTTVDVCLP
jgi:hypothetical protein